MERIYLNDGWRFTEHYQEAYVQPDYDDHAWLQVRLPHTCKETPFHYFDEQACQMTCGYRKTLHAPVEWKGKRILLTVGAAAHDSEVFVNGISAGTHHCGYTAFTIDLSAWLQYGKDNSLFIKVDSHEDLNIPPFGHVIDYLTYGGIYRDVYLDIKNRSCIEDVFVTTRFAGRGMKKDENGIRFCEKSAVLSEVTIKEPKPGLRLRQSIRKKGEEDFHVLEKETVPEQYDGETFTDVIVRQTGTVALWDVEHPVLYELKTELLEGDRLLDEEVVTFGYRKAVFHADGFYLNGRKLKIRGLNRHQSYPYVGYAMPESMQRLDADILKYELGVNAVRTSHYPQSHYFLDRCDELGLLVFTELPGWQHIGDEAWKKQAVENVADMIRQYRNHTSIILWGVRINESVDDDEFYERTNAVAHALDPGRMTGGVRCYKKSSLLEDVYTYNDFLHDGKTKGCDSKRNVTSDMTKPYLISEYNGHMYPTKAFDWEGHRAEHAIRHANVLNEVAKQEDIAGSFGWCMFDYHTHKDFGSGDRICYHGVMDMFRNAKPAAAVYLSQQEEEPVLEVTSSMDIGEHPGSRHGDVYIITNADSVRMYKNDRFIKEYQSSDSFFRYLAHGPILLDDYIGDVLEKNENMTYRQAEDVKAVLNQAANYGMAGLSAAMYAKAAKLMLVYHMKMADAVRLYNRYIGNWGGKSTVYRFEAVKNGEVVKTLVKKPMQKVILKAEADHVRLKETHTYDVAAVRIRAVDENGNVLPYFNEPLQFETEGPIELIGPDVCSLQGGMGGTYVKSIGKAGEAKLYIRNAQTEKLAVAFSVETGV